MPFAIRLASAGAIVAAAALAGACAKGASGPEVRTAVTARMQSVQGSINDCYARALESDRELGGVMVVSFTAAPKTGEFQHVTVTRDEVGDPAVRQCVIDQVSALRLDKPPKAPNQISYSLEFAPTN